MVQNGRYQPEIDGLRAVAVTATVFLHAKLPGFSGGFVGVDVFFVISGFLISRMLLWELSQTGKIDFLAFYARRIRRLFPALLAVVVFTLALGTVVLSAAGERQSLSISAAAVAGFVSNYYFWRLQAWYFAGPAEWLPLLNMWTLSVEEQFYLVWPSLLALAVLIGRKITGRWLVAVLVTLIMLFIISLASFLWGAIAKPTVAFFLTPARAWEFALGGALALSEEFLCRLKRIAGLLTIGGLGAIVVSVVAFRPGYPFSIVVVLAAVGAAAVIAGVTAKPSSFVGSVLGAAPLVIIGKLSYSWYLWHWPLLSLMRLYDFGEVSLKRDLVVVFISLGFAALTYVFLENPIRRLKPWPLDSVRRTVAVGAGMSIAVALLAGALGYQAEAAMLRSPWLKAIYAAKNGAVHAPPSCFFADSFSVLPPAQACLIGASSGPTRILLWGDSYAQHLVEMIRENGARNGYAGIVRGMAACPPLAHLANQPTHLRQACLMFNDAVIAEIPVLAQNGVTGIILSSRQFGFPYQLWKEALRGVLSAAKDHGLRVLVIAPIPAWSLASPECLAHRTVEGCEAKRAVIDQMRNPLLSALTQVVGEFDNARLWDPIRSFCSDDVCTPVRDDVILYSDRWHLSLLGARYLANAASPYLVWLIR